MPSGEMVAPMIDAFLRDRPHAFPLNLPELGPGARPPARRRGRGDVHRRRRRACTRATRSGCRRCSRNGCAGSRPRRRRRSRAALSGDREQGRRGDAARPARGPHRLRPRRADDRRDARRHRAVAAAVRVSRRLQFDALTVHVADDVDEMARDAAVDAAGGAAGRDRGAGRGERHARHRQLAARVPRGAGRDARHRVGPRARVPHGRVRRAAAVALGELPALHARAGRGAAAGDGVPLPRRRRAPIPRPKRRGTRRCCAPIRSTCAARGSARTATSRSTIRRSPTSTTRATSRSSRSSEASRRQQVGEGHFATIDDVPTHAITVTIPALLRAPPACS